MTTISGRNARDNQTPNAYETSLYTGSLSEALRNEAEIWRLTQIINGIQAAIDPGRTLTQSELVGRAWELAKSADPITEKQARNKV